MATAASPIHPAVAKGFRIYARVAGWLMAGVGLSVLVGWALEVRLLTSLVPGAVNMKAHTALTFVLSALALLAYVGTNARLAKACGIFSFLVLISGFASLVAYKTGSTLWVEQFFIDHEAIAFGTPPGQMSQLTAVGFVVLALIGMASCLKESRFTGPVIDALSILLLTLSMAGLAAFGATLGAISGGAVPFHPVAAHTSLLFLLAALAWMSARPERGMTRLATADSIGGAVARRLLLPSLLLPVLITYLTQWIKTQFMLTDEFMSTLVAVFTGGAVASLVWWVAHLLDRVERERRETQRMRDSAATDGLTGLPNRRAFDEALAELLRSRREKDARFSLLMLDLDFFKSFNDSFGHLAGDDALRITARLLRDAVRPRDLPARYGGEEFVVLLPESRGEQATQIGERINELFRKEVWPNRPVTVSIGVAEAHHGDDSASLIARADAALYAAKHGGRDRTVLAEMPVSAAG